MNTKAKISTKGGQAMITSVIFFLFISLTTIAGLVSPTVRDYTVSRVDANSKQSYYLTESGSEDFLYRLFKGVPVTTSENLSINGNSVATVVDTSGSSRFYFESSGSFDNLDRKLRVVFAEGPTASFSYGLQVGEGGVDLQSGTIIGDVFSNGPITGDSSSSITGTAISASSSPLFVDQANGSGIPYYDINFGDTNNTQDITQGFTPSTSGPINKIQLYMKKSGSPGNATVRIMNDNNTSGGHHMPGSTVLASGTLSSSSVGTTYAWVDVTMTTNPTLTAGTMYWFIVDGSTSSKAYYIIGASSLVTGLYDGGAAYLGQYGGLWTDPWVYDFDFFFKVYLGGINGLIAGSSGSQWNPLHVGTVSGTAQANTVNYTNATGLIYCQSGTGNNKSCTYQADPSQQSFPISDDYVTNWKTEAEAGGVNNGNYTVSSGNASLGPKKIVGNLSVSGGGTLTVTGTLWVTGNITITGGSHIVLSSSYGAYDGIIVGDGSVQIGGGSTASGSGTSGSYLVILTTSSSGSAIDISGGSGAVILYAKDGTLSVTGGATLKSAVARRIVVSGGSQLIYESGLASLEFQGNGAAVSQISIGSWTEIE